jgi:hypothetical protein
VKVTAADVVAL